MSSAGNNENSTNHGLRPFKKMRTLINRVSTATANRYNRFLQGIMNQDGQETSISTQRTGLEENIEENSTERRAAAHILLGINDRSRNKKEK